MKPSEGNKYNKNCSDIEVQSPTAGLTESSSDQNEVKEQPPSTEKFTFAETVHFI